MHPRPGFGTVPPALMTRTAALALALALTGLGSAGCKKQQPSQPTRVGRGDTAITPADPRLPAPHKLSAEVDAGIFIAAPADLLAAAGAYIPAPPTLAKLAEFMLGTQGPADFATAASGLLDGQRPWVGVQVEREDVLHVPLQKGAASKLQSLLARYPKRGNFGAVELPRPALEMIGRHVRAADRGEQAAARVGRRGQRHADDRRDARGPGHRPRAAAHLLRQVARCGSRSARRAASSCSGASRTAAIEGTGLGPAQPRHLLPPRAPATSSLPALRDLAPGALSRAR
jgi:hypothetical protein